MYGQRWEKKFKKKKLNSFVRCTRSTAGNYIMRFVMAWALDTKLVFMYARWSDSLVTLKCIRRAFSDLRTSVTVHSEPQERYGYFPRRNVNPIHVHPCRINIYVCI